MGQSRDRILLEYGSGVAIGNRFMGGEMASNAVPVRAKVGSAARKTGGYNGPKVPAEQRPQGISSHVASLALTDRESVPIGHEGANLGGRTTCQTSPCAFGDRTGKALAVGQEAKQVKDGTRVQVDIGRQMRAAKVTLGPHCDPDGIRRKI
jgi:hypothetical protein